jgi:predicted nucleic acid-binding protein
MIAVDTNILLYASREDSQFFEPAYACIEGLANARAPWAIPWPCVHEFFSVSTNPRIHKTPTPIATALKMIAAWMESPSLVLLCESERHWAELCAGRGRAHHRRPGARCTIAALCRSMEWGADCR